MKKIIIIQNHTTGDIIEKIAFKLTKEFKCGVEFLRGIQLFIVRDYRTGEILKKVDVQGVETVDFNIQIY